MPTVSQALTLAETYQRAGRWQLCEEICRRIVAAEPAHAEAWALLGVALYGQGRSPEAAECFRRALGLNPKLIRAHYSLGTLFLLEKQYDQALDHLQHALALRPTDAQILGNLGVAWRAVGKPEQALACDCRAVEQQPNHAGLCSNLAQSLLDLGRPAEALDWLRRAATLRPDVADIHYNLANTLRELGEIEEAIAAYRHAVTLQPELAEAFYNLGNLYQEQGEPEQALACYQRALQLQPDNVRFHDNQLLALHYRPGITLAELAVAHAEFERQHATPSPAAWCPPGPPDGAGRPWRLGFVSADLGAHPVGRFLIGVLENLDVHQAQVVCYNDRVETDAIADRFRRAASEWRDVSSLSDTELTEQIRADRIDVLFDLAGHTARNRLLVFARRAAPVQITWIGYEGTTGLGAIDYLLADGRLTPPGSEQHCREQVLRLPDGYVCYDPPADAPPVGPLPALAAGRVTFASFNNPAKITPSVVATWAQILHRVPHARLLLKYRGLDRQPSAARLRRWFAQHQIDAERVEIAGWSPHSEYLAAYADVDLALDPWPFNGGITTCDALWMGVPVITWPGETFASRHSLSYLTTLGLTETIADSREQYLELAVRLASDLPRLAELRSGLRARMAASPLCDGRRLAESLLVLLHGLLKSSPSIIL